MLQATEKYFKNHPAYNSLVHILGGVGIGILITYPFIGPHPVRWGVSFFALSILGHLYPMTLKKK
jgi:hypothetical protein